MCLSSSHSSSGGFGLASVCIIVHPFRMHFIWILVSKQENIQSDAAMGNDRRPSNEFSLLQSTFRQKFQLLTSWSTFIVLNIIFKLFLCHRHATFMHGGSHPESLKLYEQWARAMNHSLPYKACNNLSWQSTSCTLNRLMVCSISWALLGTMHHFLTSDLSMSESTWNYFMTDSYLCMNLLLGIHWQNNFFVTFTNWTQ